jgi:RNase H-fold protein (predicted Holliday junction resolvase)
VIESLKKSEHMKVNTVVVGLPTRFRNEGAVLWYRAGLNLQFRNGLGEIKAGEEIVRF